MTLEQRLQSEIQDSKRWIECTQNNSTYKRDLKKRVELINWVLINMKNPDIQICSLIETRTNQIIDDINKKDSVLEDHPLDSERRILDWVLFLVYCTE
jgi:stress response protein YsnF